jgi:hypothetical protein
MAAAGCTVTAALAALLDDGADLSTLDAEALRRFLDACAVEHEGIELVRRRLEAELQRRLNESPRSDHLVKRADAAARLDVTEDWLLRHPDLPFRVELSPGVVRYSSGGIDRYIAERRRRG